MLTVVILIKLWTEIALLALVGQWVLLLLLGARADGNLIYGLLCIVTRPVVGLVGKLLPGEGRARRHEAVSAMLLLWVWLGATAGKVWWCLGSGLAQCR